MLWNIVCKNILFLNHRIFLGLILKTTLKVEGKDLQEANTFQNNKELLFLLFNMNKHTHAHTHTNTQTHKHTHTRTHAHTLAISVWAGILKFRNTKYQKFPSPLFPYYRHLHFSHFVIKFFFGVQLKSDTSRGVKRHKMWHSWIG